MPTIDLKENQIISLQTAHKTIGKILSQNDRGDDLTPILNEIADYAEKGFKLYGPYDSYDNAISELLDQVQVLYLDNEKNHPDKQKIRFEAIHLGAIVTRFIYELLGEDIKE